MAYSIIDVENLAHDLVDEVEDRIKDGDDLHDALYEVIGDAARSETTNVEDNWHLVDEFYANEIAAKYYDVNYDGCEKTNDVEKLLQETAFAIVWGILEIEISKELDNR